MGPEMLGKPEIMYMAIIRETYLSLVYWQPAGFDMALRSSQDNGRQHKPDANIMLWDM